MRDRKWEFQKQKFLPLGTKKEEKRVKARCMLSLVGGQAESENVRRKREEKIVSWPTKSSDIQYSPHSCQTLWHLSVKILLSVIFIFGRTKRTYCGAATVPGNLNTFSPRLLYVRARTSERREENTQFSSFNIFLLDIVKNVYKIFLPHDEEKVHGTKEKKKMLAELSSAR